MNESEKQCDDLAIANGWTSHRAGWADRWYKKDKQILFVEIKKGPRDFIHPRQIDFQKMITDLINNQFMAKYELWIPEMKDSIFNQELKPLNKRNYLTLNEIDILQKENANLSYQCERMKNLLYVLDEQLKDTFLQLYDMAILQHDKTRKLPPYWRDRIRIAYNNLWFAFVDPTSKRPFTPMLNFEDWCNNWMFEGILGNNLNVKNIDRCEQWQWSPYDDEYQGTQPILTDSCLKKINSPLSNHQILSICYKKIYEKKTRQTGLIEFMSPISIIKLDKLPELPAYQLNQKSKFEICPVCKERIIYGSCIAQRYHKNCYQLLEDESNKTLMQFKQPQKIEVVKNNQNRKSIFENFNWRFGTPTFFEDKK